VALEQQKKKTLSEELFGKPTTFLKEAALYVDHGSAGERRGGINTHLIDEGEFVLLELVTLRGEMLVAWCY